MTALTDTLINHSSVRSFEKRTVSEDIKEQLILSAQSASSSKFLQAYSIVEVQDRHLREQIEAIANCTGYVADTGVFYIFVADLNRHAEILKAQNQSPQHLTGIEPLLVSVVDTTLAAQNMAACAESLGLGICFIGGVRNDLSQIGELLQLPPRTFPVFGLSIGYPKQNNERKPRIPAEGILHKNTYQPVSGQVLQSYDRQMSDYYASRSSNNQETNWTKKVLNIFATDSRPETTDFLRRQGFID